MTQSKWFAYLCVALLAATACSSSKKLDLGGTCSINSDCNDPMSCAFGSCHQQCTQIRDCPQGDRCVFVNGVGVCQLPAEASCSGAGTCDPSLLCAPDKICRTPCTAAGTCSLASHACVNGVCEDPNESAVLNGDGGVKGDGAAGATGDAGSTSNGGSTGTGGQDAAGAGTGGVGGSKVVDAAGSTSDGGLTPGKDGPASSSGDAGGAADTPVGGGGAGGGTGGVGGGGAGGSGTLSVCPQTQFGLVAEGDSNPNFHGGVGLRTATQLLNFTAYTGPDPNAPADAGTSTVNLVYVQAFAPVSAQKQGPAQPLFTPQYVTYHSDGYGASFSLVAAIAPTGQVAIIYWNGYGIGAAFLGPVAGDAGASSGNLQVTRQVQLEVSGIGSLPHVIWSVAFNAFVFSYQISDANQLIHVRKFYSDGRPVGGDTDGVPTDRSDNLGGGGTGFAVVTNQNPYLGVFYGQYANWAPFLTILDTQGNQVGKTFSLQATPAGTAWLTGAATSAGYVAFYNQGGIQASFVNPDAKGNVSAAQYTDAGVVDGFHFNGTETASRAIALNDDVGGAGGVGLAIAYSGKVSFAYVNPDHSHVNPATVIAHSWAAGDDYLNISNSAGSFAVSLWNNAEHKVQVAATTCPQ